MGVIGGRRNAHYRGDTVDRGFGSMALGAYIPDLVTGIPLPFISTMVLIWCTLTAAALAVYNEVRREWFARPTEDEIVSSEQRLKKKPSGALWRKIYSWRIYLMKFAIR